MTERPDQPDDERRPDSSGTEAPESATYKVGNRRPPVEHRFPPGRSGNPKGGKKRQPPVSEQVARVLRHRVRMTEGGKTKSRSLQEVMLMNIGAKAAKGDLKCAQFLLELQKNYRESDALTIDPGSLSSDSQAISRTSCGRCS